MDADLVARLLFAFAAFWLVVAALIRTWASSYLRAAVVYAAEVKTESLVADGPYRQVRNPLYFAHGGIGISNGAKLCPDRFFPGGGRLIIGSARSDLSLKGHMTGSPAGYLPHLL